MRRKLPHPCLACGGVMTYQVRGETLEHQGYTFESRVKGWWCTACEASIIEPGWLKFRERAVRHLQAKAACLNSWGSNLPDESTILGVQADLDRLRATCTVAVKRELPGQWAHAFEQVPTFEAALDLVPRLLEAALEVAIFLDCEDRGGVVIWSSIAPNVANRFEHNIADIS